VTQADPRQVVLLGAAMGLVLAIGCSEDARLADHDIPTIEAGPVHDQGIVLGPEASPKEVAFVLLRAIRDDVRAGADHEARQAALERQMAVCDPDFIYGLYRRAFGKRAVFSRDEWVFKKVRLWAPAFSYYADSFDLDLANAQSRMIEGKVEAHAGLSGETVSVDLPAKDPEGSSAADVMVRVWLHRHEHAGWRAFHVGFAKTRPPAASSPVPQTLPSG
jgi:hypothetical protein